MKKENKAENSSPEDVTNTQAVESKGKVPMNPEAKKAEAKQKYEPWGKFETETLQLSAAEERVKRNDLMLNIEKLIISVKYIREDIETNLRLALMEKRAAQLKLDNLNLDKNLDITYNELSTKLRTYNNELKRHDRNIRAFEIQLNKGRPVIGGGTVEAESETKEEGDKQ